MAAFGLAYTGKYTTTACIDIRLTYNSDMPAPQPGDMVEYVTEKGTKVSRIIYAVKRPYIYFDPEINGLKARYSCWVEKKVEKEDAE